MFSSARGHMPTEQQLSTVAIRITMFFATVKKKDDLLIPLRHYAKKNNEH
jgi:hypothetical protein